MGDARFSRTRVLALCALVLVSDLATARADELRVAVFDDPRGSSDFPSVLSRPDVFRAVAGNRFVAGYTRSVIWLRVALPPAPHGAMRVLEVGPPTLDRVVLYRLDDEGRVVRQAAGDGVPVAERALKTRRIAFAMPVSDGTATLLYLRVESVSPVNLDLRLSDAETFADSQAFQQIFNGLFFGIIGFAFAYNLFIFLAVRDASYGYYVIYLAIVAALHLRLLGYTEAIFWPAAPALANLTTPFLIAGVAVSAAQFQRVFLATAESHRRIDFLFRAVQAASVMALAALPLTDARVVLQALLAIALATTLVSAAAIVAAFRRGFGPARYLLVSVVCLLPSYAISALAAFGAIEPNFFAENVNRMAVALEAVLFSFALADRIRLLEAEGRAVAEQLAATQRRITQTLFERQEEDRKRIASELHDALGQTLVLLRNRVMRLVSGPSASTPWEEIDRLSSEAIERTRDLATGLYPPELRDLGIAAALEAMLERAIEGTGVAGACACTVPDSALEPERRINLFRIAQEAVTNALKHARPGRIEISLTAGEHISLTVTDDGVGSPSEFQGRPVGFGLAGMRERTRLMGGDFDIRARIGGGTIVAVSIPFRRPA